VFRRFFAPSCWGDPSGELKRIRRFLATSYRGDPSGKLKKTPLVVFAILAWELTLRVSLKEFAGFLLLLAAVILRVS
jgi:hypothetical protein